jgi:hypothetical protein
MQKAAGLISVVFHPVFILVYLFGAAIAIDPYIQFVMPPARVRPMILILTINTVLLPIAAILFIKSRGLVQSIYLTSAKERRLGLVIVFVFYIITYVLWRQLTLPHSFLAIFSAVLVTLLLVYILVPYLKISMHTLAVGGMIGTFLGLFKAHGFIDIPALAIGFGLFGISGTARLILHAHTAREINYGVLTGIVVFYVFVGDSFYF